MNTLVRILIFIAIIILNVYIAGQFRNVAADKGYDSSKYFHLCFWCGIVGYLLVIALPDRGDRTPAPTHLSAPTLPDTEVKPMAEAEAPHFWSPGGTGTATACGENNIRCNNCHKVQFKGNRRCVQCGTAFSHIYH